MEASFRQHCECRLCPCCEGNAQFALAHVQIAEPEGFGAKKPKAKAVEKKRAASTEPPDGIKKFLRPADAASTSAEASSAPASAAARAASPPAHGWSSAPVSATASPDRDTMRRLMADAAMRRLERPNGAVQTTSQLSEQEPMRAPTQPPRVEADVLVISDSDETE